MTTPAKYFILRGWAKWHASTSNQEIMDRIVKRRPGGNWGIATPEAVDYWALQWRRYDFREKRAQRAVGRDKMRVMSYSGDGPLTVEVIPGVPIAGWTADPEEVQACADYDRMMKARLEAQRCCSLLREMDMPFNVRKELSRLDYEDACNEAMGY